jgi:hypothetical protein
LGIQLVRRAAGSGVIGETSRLKPPRLGAIMLV